MRKWDDICALSRRMVMLRGSPAHFKQGQSSALCALGNLRARLIACRLTIFDRRYTEIAYHFERELANGPSAFDGDTSSSLCDQGLQASKFAAPNSFHVSIPLGVARFGGTSNSDRSDLHNVSLRSAR